jgi:K+-transporting ATPase ATPase C chain
MSDDSGGGMSQKPEIKKQKLEPGLWFAVRTSAILLPLFIILLGIVYPLAVTAIGQVLFPHKVSGSLITRAGEVVGSALLGQSFDSPKYFWGRLSATTPPYNPSASGGSNFSPNNPKLLEAVKARVDALHKADPANTDPIPVDLVTASGSGLDPHVSLAAIEYQLPRVAGARNMKPEDVQALVNANTEDFGFGLFQAPYVNVLKLNMVLDEGPISSTRDTGHKK